MGSGDRVSCFYCGEQRFHQKLHDNPWHKHEKVFFFWCKFVLEKEDVKYVEKVCQKHSGLLRPDIKNPTQSAATNP